MSGFSDYSNSLSDEGVIADIVYAEPEGAKLYGDFYVPKGDGPFPVIIAAPGGGWFKSDRKSYRQWGLHLAGLGYAFFAIQYRVAAHEKMFPKAIQDVISAVQFVRGSAADMNVDPDRIGLLGSSAGAHVASLAALAPNTPLFGSTKAVNEFGVVPASVKAFIGVYGVYDMFALWQQEICTAPTQKARRSECLLGCPPHADRQLYFDASPLSYVRDETKKPAVFLSYGTDDSMVNSQTQSEPFLRALKQAGYQVRDVPVSGAGHFWFSEDKIEDPGSYSAFLAPRLMSFLKRYL